MNTTIQSAKTVSVVIPTYNGLELLKKHLEAVFSVLKSGDEVIIVDDASTDDTIAWLVDRYALNKTENQALGSLHEGSISYKKEKLILKVLQQINNLRFAASCNNGVEIAQNSYILLLNNDVEPLTGCREALLAHFSDDKVFGVGCLEFEQVIGDKKSGKNKLWFERGLFKHSRGDDMKTGETAWVSGGSGMFDKEKWQLLGGFDKRFYPAYWEDIDLSFRARKKGWKILFEENAQVLHQHESTNQDVFGIQKMQSMSWKNAFLFTRLHASFIQMMQHLLWLPYWFLKKSGA